MTLHITDDEITSDLTDAYADRHRDGWAVSTRDVHRRFDKNQAISAMMIAEEVTKNNPDRVLVASLEAEL